jgi:(p)ppGpp synthase/HD superfamily hydrolase
VQQSPCEGEAARIVAVLHDVIEDKDWTPDALRNESASEDVLTALNSVTKRKGESYAEFIDRAAHNPIGREVKIADLRENMDLSRMLSRLRPT